MSWGVSPWVYLVWDSLGFLDLVAISFPILGKFSIIISSIFSWPFFLSSYSGTPMIRMLGRLTLSQRSLVSFNSSFFFPSRLHLFPSFYLPPHLSYLLPVILLLVPSRVLLISVIALFIIDWLFFISSRSLLNFSCIFSILISRLFICNSILFSKFWIIFTVIILNSFPVSRLFTSGGQSIGVSASAPVLPVNIQG